ncbi:hypothetical protein ACFLWI_02475 [Chloroflexota bacterium]
MSDEENSKEITVRLPQEVEIQQFEEKLLAILSSYNLPIEGIFIPISERVNVFRNLDTVITKIDFPQRSRSVYVSKFAAAVTSGLFDAALNYLWDETIIELRRRVAQYDLSYFFDNAIGSADRRRDLNDEDDLVKISDSELVYGAKEIGLISEVGFKHLDYIRFMRNWVSAAHPNQNEITGLQLISWLETCIKEVISLPLSNVAVEVKKLLHSIKSTSITSDESKEIATFFINLEQEQVNTLIFGLFGIYTRNETDPQTRQNIRYLTPHLWERVDENTRQQLGIKYGKFVATNDTIAKSLAREFLQQVSAESYIPDDLRATEIKIAIEYLLNAHREINNFYNEPPMAKELSRLVGPTRSIPRQVQNDYIFCLVEVFLTNGNGIAWNAEPTYKNLLDLFDQRQALLAVASFTQTAISSRLQFPLCREKFKELISIMESKVSAPAIKEFINKIKTHSGQPATLKDDSAIKREIQSLKAILATTT